MSVVGVRDGGGRRSGAGQEERGVRTGESQMSTKSAPAMSATATYPSDGGAEAATDRPRHDVPCPPPPPMPSPHLRTLPDDTHIALLA